MNKKIVKYLQSNLTKASLKSFGIKDQFIELEFVSERHEEIMFFIDCRVFSANSEIKKAVELLRKGCLDTYEIGYFVFINRKPIIDVSITKEGDLLLMFSDELSIMFDLNSNENSNLAITFREKKNSNYVSVDMNGEMDFQMDSIIVS